MKCVLSPQTWRGFTTISVANAVIGWHHGNVHVLAVARCTTLFTMTAFHAVLLCDPSAFKRLRAQRGYSRLLFHCGNFALHIAPVIALAYATVRVQWVHILSSWSVFAAWGYLSSDPPFVFDSVYIALQTHQWHFCVLCGALSTLALLYT